MELTKGQIAIIDILMLEPMDVQGLKELTHLSDSFVRNTVRYLEVAGQIEKVDNRVPYIYRIPVDDPRVKKKALIETYEQKIMTRDKSNTIVNMLMKAPVNMWPELADDLEAAAYAIRNLDNEGKLIETLDN